MMDTKDFVNIRPRAFSTGSMAEILRQRRHFMPTCTTPRRTPCTPAPFRPARVPLSSDERRNRLCSEIDDVDSTPSTPDLRLPSRGEATNIPRIRVNPVFNHSTPDISPIIARRQRINSLPADSAVPADRDYVDTLNFYRRFSVLSKYSTMLGTSLRSIPRDRQPSICSTVSHIDDELLARDESFRYGMFNISPASSLYMPSVRLAVHQTTGGPDRNVLLTEIIALGENDDCDDVFAEETTSPNGKRTTCVKLGADEYVFTFIDAELATRKSEEEPVDGHIVLFDPKQPESVDSAKQVILVASGDAVGLPVIAIATTSSLCRQAESESPKDSLLRVPVVDLQSFLPHHLFGMLEDILRLLLPDPERPSTQDDLLNHRKLRTAFSHNDAVDKQTLFNRFFWRPLPSKSCENLLAL